ncbi:RVP_2 domain-containing protein [Cephalotus follicularis]|uniref:RVP_2 domain-containing protein n=1 Tax=Cephalotus follicularis TaxID=3775 RepID=A0A1Q3B6Y9_CEPFO|nr:RVP_2 domain-containing protein [Cephalotus follicularis]
MYTDSVYRSCNMSIAGISLYADLIVLPIRDFDVILGMDWLSAHRARMDCYDKTVDFCLPDGTTFSSRETRGSRHLSYLLSEHRDTWRRDARDFWPMLLIEGRRKA